MTLQNDRVLGTMFPVQVSTILQKSNAEWGCKDVRLLEGQLSFALFTYLGGLHLDGGAPEIITEAVVQLLHRYGLPGYLKATSSLYDVCVRQGSFHYGEISEEMLTILPGDPNWYRFVDAFGKWNTDSMMKAWALRFLKRFTVKNADHLLTGCLRDFVATDNRNKVFDRHDNFVSQSVKARIEDIACLYLEYVLQDFNVENVLSSIERLEFSPTPNGVNNCCHDPRHRVGRVLAYIGILPSKEDPSIFGDYIEGIDTKGRTTVNVNAVPKDYKSYRIVSPDDPINLAFQQAIVEEIMRCIRAKGLEESMPLHDQEIMRALTYATTSGGQNYATLDMSRASDTVRMNLIRKLFPEKVHSLISCYRPKFFNVAELGISSRVLYMAAPMGSAFTLLLQSLVFWAIDCATCHYCAMMSQDFKNLGQRRQINGVVIYPKSCKAMGDDQQVPQEYAEECIDALQRFGFIVNVSKSFYDADALFRESCGAEALGDEPIDGFYIPRHSLEIGLRRNVVENFSDMRLLPGAFWNDRTRTGEVTVQTTTTAIIAMCKVFVLTGLPQIGKLIQRWISSEIPEMTVSEFGTPADDLWGAQDIVHTYKPLPMAEFRDREVQIKSHLTPIVRTGTIRKLVSIKVVDIRYMRPVHWAITSKRKKLASIWIPNAKRCPVCSWLQGSPVNEALFISRIDYYRYQAWLRKGPNYESELDRLLGVSSPTPGLDVISKPEVGISF